MPGPKAELRWALFVHCAFALATHSACNKEVNATAGRADGYGGERNYHKYAKITFKKESNANNEKHEI